MDVTVKRNTGASGGASCPPAGDAHAERLLRLVHWTSAASRQLRRRLAEVAQAIDLSDAELLVVWLCRGDGHVQVELASAIGISPAQMSGLVERLRARGLVAVHRQAMDRRRQVWRTSPEGESLLGEVAGQLHDLAAAVGTLLTADEQQAVLSLCEHLVGSGRPQRATNPFRLVAKWRARRATCEQGGGVA